MIGYLFRIVIWAALFSFALFGMAALLTGCAEMKYVAKCTTDINSNCN